MTNDMKEHLLDTKQLARYLNVSEATLKDWVYKRRIPFLKVGRLIRFRLSEIEGWLEASRSDVRR